MLVLRPEQQASELARQLENEGATPVLIPAIRILPPSDWTQIDDVVGRLQSFDWIIFTSVNGVDSFFSRVRASDALPARVGAIGPGTRDRLTARGLDVAWMPGS
ncbi:MAG: uroporphyrinogen-III synthase, partial [Actinomycetota bacterium]